MQVRCQTYNKPWPGKPIGATLQGLALSLKPPQENVLVECITLPIGSWSLDDIRQVPKTGEGEETGFVDNQALEP